MATGRSFTEYVKGKCYDGLYDAAAQYATENYRLLELRLKKVRSMSPLGLWKRDVFQRQINTMMAHMQMIFLWLRLLIQNEINLSLSF